MEVKKEFESITNQLKQIVLHYNKRKGTELLNVLCDLDLIINKINVDIVIETGIPNILNMINSNSQIEEEMIEIVNEILEKIFINCKNELFTEQYIINNYNNFFDFANNLEQKNLIKQIKNYFSKNNNANSLENGYEECVIRTDSKYLTQIKKIENNMFLENKRRQKYKRLNSEIKNECITKTFNNYSSPVKGKERLYNNSKERSLTRSPLVGSTSTKISESH
jgi:hypothetical protein